MLYRVTTTCFALFVLAWNASCSTYVPPTTRGLAPLDASVDRVLYVTTNRQREDVLTALTRAGFRSTSDARETTLVLVVRLGGGRSSRRCGVLRNVSFELRQVGVRVAVIKGRGWTGACGGDDILLEMSGELARLFGEAA